MSGSHILTAVHSAFPPFLKKIRIVFGPTMSYAKTCEKLFPWAVASQPQIPRGVLEVFSSL